MPMPTPMGCHIGDEDFTTFDAPNDSNLLMKNGGHFEKREFSVKFCSARHRSKGTGKGWT